MMKFGKDDQEFNEINKILTIGIIIVVAICLVLFFLNIVISILNGMDKIVINYDYLAFMFLYLSFTCFYSFSKFKNFYHLIIGIGFSLTFLCMLALHFVYLAVL